MKQLKKYLLKFSLLFLSFIPFIAFGQDENQIEMADTFRDDGKIYVVIAIIALILLGLIIYLTMIDRKVSNLERKMRKGN